MAVENSSKKVNTFSIGFKEEAFNEAEYAKQVAKHLGTNHHEYMISVDKAKALIPKLLDFYDEPFSDSSAIPTYLVSQINFKIILIATKFYYAITQNHFFKSYEWKLKRFH